MIKGVNKQIVEINYTKNDYIEKAILIINPSKSALSKEIISQKANDYMQTIINKKDDSYLRTIKSQARIMKNMKKKKKAIATAIGLSFFLIATIISVIILLV